MVECHRRTVPPRMTALVVRRVRSLHAPAASRRVIGWAAAVLSLLIVVALVAVAGFPTGERSPAALVPPAGRLAAQTAIDDVRVLLTVQEGELVGIVAYKGEKGWLGIDLEPVAGSTPAAWAATDGADGDAPVPAMSMVYGRADGANVEVEWSDGRTDRAATARDGAYVVARRGRVSVENVIVLDDDGGTLLEVTEL